MNTFEMYHLCKYIGRSTNLSVIFLNKLRFTLISPYSRSAIYCCFITSKLDKKAADETSEILQQTKGQTKSKRFFQADDSSKKRTN